MKVAVIGLWHLGCVTAACLANAGHDVLGFDSDITTLESLKKGTAPIFEPGLNDLLQQAIAHHSLQFTHEKEKLNEVDIAWITFDTPVDEKDHADVDAVTHQIKTILPYLKSHTLVLISSQLPVGTTRKLVEYSEQSIPEKQLTFAYSPENLRLGKAISVFTQPDRIVMGLQTETDQSKIATLLNPFSNNIVWMSIESAEMTKHALNAFLATSVVFINELATLCERVGADARDVEKGLKSEERIGPKAYLRPGAAIAGGTLARDVNYLIQIGEQEQTLTPLFSALLKSNDAHKQWACQRLLSLFKSLKGKTIATLGLTYKADTDTLRRSTAIETCQWLSSQGAKVKAFDPALKSLPTEFSDFIELKNSLDEAIQHSDAIIIATEWPEFTNLHVDQLLAQTNYPYVFDPSGFLAKHLSQDDRIRYFSVGKQS